jgi:Flp pilus assembly protein TadD
VAAAETMIDSGKVDEAVTYLNSRTAAFEHNAGVRQTLGHIAMLKGETEKAVGFFNEARLLAPEDDGVLEDLIRAQIAVGKFSEAQFNIEYILKDDKNKDRRDLKQLQARCLMNVDRPVEAREILIKLTSDPAGAKEVESWIELGNVSYILRDQNRLRMSSQRVLSMAPARMEGYTLRALWQRRSGDLNGALTSVDKAMEIKATDPDVQVLRALVLKDLGRVDEAREGYAAVLREDPENEAARKGMDSLKLATVPETASPAEQR